MDFANSIILIQHTRIHQETDGRETAAGRDILKRKSSLPMTDQIRAVLLAEQERQSSVKTLQPADYVCVNSDNQPISPNYYSQCFKKFLRDHGLREVRLHDLRHPNVKPRTQNQRVEKAFSPR